MALFTDQSEHLGNIDRVMLPHLKYVQQTYSQQMFNLVLTATTTGIAAGNIVGASAAAATNFGLINPVASGRNLVLTKFGVGVISGTIGAGPIFHGVITTLTSAASPGGTIRNQFLGSTIASVAKPWALAAGSALTNATAPVTLRMANFSSTNTAQASVQLVAAVEEMAGDLIVAPGTMWLPLWSGAGTAVLNAYSISWYEMGL